MHFVDAPFNSSLTRCLTDYYDYPTCKYCLNTTTCNSNGFCDTSGNCVCSFKTKGTNCEKCDLFIWLLFKLLSLCTSSSDLFYLRLGAKLIDTTGPSVAFAPLRTVPIMESAPMIRRRYAPVIPDTAVPTAPLARPTSTEVSAAFTVSHRTRAVASEDATLIPDSASVRRA